MQAGVRLKFGDIYKEIEGSTNPSAALELFLGDLPTNKEATLAVNECDGDVSTAIAQLDGEKP